MKKKLLFVITKSNWGGAGRYVYDLANAFKEEYEVAVLLGGGEGTLGEKLESAGIRTISAVSLARDIRAHKDMAAFFELRALFKKERPDIVHLNSSKAGGLGALAARFSGVSKIVYTVHGWAFNEPVSWRSKAFRWSISLLTAFFSSRIITVSHFDDLHSPLGWKTSMVHNGVSSPQFLSRADARAKLLSLEDTEEEGVIIGTIAELNKNKGLETLIRALSKIKKGKLLIVGEGEDRNKLESLIAELSLRERVKLLGFIENAPELLKGLDIFALPSRKEGLPYVLLEAGSAELPVVASIVGGIPEIIEDQLSGLLVPSGDEDALVQALNELIQSPATRARYGMNLKEKIERYFSLSEMVSLTNQVYNS